MKSKTFFVMYHDYWNWFKLLTDDELGKLIRAVFLYEREKKEPASLDEKLNILFCMIKETLDKDRSKYESVCSKNRENAKLRWQRTKEQLN